MIRRCIFCLVMLLLFLPPILISCSSEPDSNFQGHDELAERKWLEQCEIEKKKSWSEENPDWAYLLESVSSSRLENINCKMAYTKLQSLTSITPRCGRYNGHICQTTPDPERHFKKAVAWSALKNLKKINIFCETGCELGLLKYLPRIERLHVNLEERNHRNEVVKPTLGLNDLVNLGPKTPGIVSFRMASRSRAFYNLTDKVKRVDPTIPVGLRADKACVHSLKSLESFANLEELDLGNKTVCYTWDNRAITNPRVPIKKLNFAKLHRLKKLRLPLADFNLISPIKRLVELDISGSRIQSFKPLAKHKYLRKLTIENVPDHENYNNLHMKPKIRKGVTTAHLRELGPLPLLEYLRIKNKYTSKAVINASGNIGFPLLHTLELEDVKGSYTFEGTNKLESIKLEKIDQTLASNLMGYKSLSNLEILGSVSDVENFADASALRTLKLSKVKIQSTKFLTKLNDLKELYLDGNDLESLEGLKTGLANLKKIHIDADHQFGLHDKLALQNSRTWHRFYATDFGYDGNKHLAEACAKSIAMRSLARFANDMQTLAPLHTLVNELCKVETLKAESADYANGQTLHEKEGAIYYEDGSLFYSKETFKYPNGQNYELDNNLYFPTGQIYYDQKTKKSYYPNGDLARDYTPNSGGYYYYYYPGTKKNALQCGVERLQYVCLTVAYPNGSWAYQRAHQRYWMHPTRDLSSQLSDRSYPMEVLEVLLGDKLGQVPPELSEHSRLFYLLKQMTKFYPAQ